MFQRFLCIAVVIPGLLLPALAQSGLTVTGAPYNSRGITVAPGQIVRLQVAGLKTILPCADPTCISERVVKATVAPLPTMLAGISVTVNEYVEQFLAFPYMFTGSFAAPLVSIRQVFTCSTVSTDLTPNPNPATTTPACFQTFLTLQIPYELSYNPVGNPFVAHEAIISENGASSQPFVLGVNGDQIHVVTTCDSSPNQATCRSIVAHLDGTLVSYQSPAKAGETVVIYAWGLGQTMPPAKTGNLAPIPAPALSRAFGGAIGPRVRFDFSPNAAPAYVDSVLLSVAPAYLTPGQIGLYQVAVQLPTVFPQIMPCDSTFVLSNLTIDLRGTFSVDGAATCVSNEP